MVWVHLFGVFAHLFIVFANDVADVTVDRARGGRTLVSGGSGVLVEGKISVATLKRAALAMALLMPVPLWVAELGVWSAVYAGATVLLVWLYSFPPVRASYRGWGSILQGVGVGVVLPLVGFQAQAGSLGRLFWWFLVPTFLLGVASNLITALPDLESDGASGKRTEVVRWGHVKSRSVVFLLLACAAGYVGVLVLGVFFLSTLCVGLGWLWVEHRRLKGGATTLRFVEVTMGVLQLTWILMLAYGLLGQRLWSYWLHGIG